MSARSSYVFCSIVAFFIVSLDATSRAAAAPVEAHASAIEGSVDYFSIEDSKTHAVELNTPFREGDRVSTGADGTVEIVFETGDLILLDNNTDLTIKSLNRDDQGSTFAVFDLLVGRVKSFVSELPDSKSLFEYHTRSAITGVAGTDFVVESKDDRTDVFNTSEPDGGNLYAVGRDPDTTRVIILPGMGTTILFGLAPVAPFLLTPEIMQSIGHLVSQSGGAAGGAAAGTAAAAGGGIGIGTMAIGAAAIGGVAVAASGGGGGGGDSAPADTTPPGDTGGDLPGGAGDVKITLQWNAAADLDLHVIDPCGNEIDFTNTSATCQGNTGQLDIDNIPGGPGSAENIFWPTGNAPTGTYEYWVRCFSRCDGINASFTLTRIVDGSRSSSSGSLSSSGQDSQRIRFSR